MKNPPPRLSIITVNYNGLIDTLELIQSVKEHVSIPYELIVVDNASRSDDADQIHKAHPWVILVRCTKNLGFAGGNNAGIVISKGKFILLINNDTVIKDDSIIYLIEKLDSNPVIGAVSPKIKFACSPEIIQYAGYTTLSSVTLRNRTIGSGQKDDGQYDQAQPTSYLHGAAMMLKKEIIQKVGLMPEVYFLYYEEIDWSTKITRFGYELHYEPRCTVFHKESQSTGRASSLQTFFLTRNRLLYAYRNCQGITKYLSLFYQVSIVLFKNSFVFLLRGRPDLAKAAFRGVWAFFWLKHKKD
ncbi:MAG: glycosyltransferase family 2 protein [Mangrovibacterium sp.]|nr:glycosyltransferase family 2 protein [Mangrovibacterium sp.]